MAVRQSISAHEEIRRRMGYSVTALASEIGYSHTYVSRVEGGQIPASARYRKAVSKALRVPEAMIFGLPAGEEP